MKSLLIFFVLTTFSISMFSQYDYEPSVLNPYGLPNPNAPEQIKDYDELIGKCDCISTARNPDGTWADSTTMIWEWRYIMNGMGVQDLTLNGSGIHSGSIRQYNQDSSSWYVHYYSSRAATAQLSAWQGERVGNEIILYKDQAAPNGMEGKYKIMFYDISQDGFNWLGQWVNMDETIQYPTWKIKCKKRKNPVSSN